MNIHSKLLQVLALTLINHPGWALTTSAVPAPSPQARVDSQVTRGPAATPVRLWPDNTVYYSLTNANKETRTAFLSAAREMTEHTTLRFVERVNQPDYLIVSFSTTFEFCGSQRGMTGGPQFILFNPQHCWGPGEESRFMRHEIMNALGASHDHTATGAETKVPAVYRSSAPHIDISQPAEPRRHIDAERITWHGKQFLKPYHGEHGPRGSHNRLSLRDIAELNRLYPAPSSSAPTVATDNGVVVDISARSLTLPENTQRVITVRYPAGVTLSRPTVQFLGTDQQAATRNGTGIALGIVGLDTVKGPQGTLVHIHLLSRPVERVQRLGLVLDAAATDTRGVPIGVSALIAVKVVPHHQWATQPQQLVSGQAHADGVARCLEAGREPRLRQDLPEAERFLGQTNDNAQLWLATRSPEDPGLALRLARCDTEKIGQWWRYDAAQGQLFDKSGKYYLDAQPTVGSMTRKDRTIALSARLRPQTTQHPLPQRWLRQGSAFVYRANPDWKLSVINGEHPGLAVTLPETTSGGQDWFWQ